MQLSALDRLLGYEIPRETGNPALDRARGVDEVRKSVQRHLEWLLNTKAILPPRAASNDPVQESLLTYGLPDFTATGIKGAREREYLKTALLLAIKRFEPRLRVEAIELATGGPDSDVRELNFHVRAWLDLQPAPERVEFDARVDLSSNRLVIGDLNLAEGGE